MGQVPPPTVDDDNVPLTSLRRRSGCAPESDMPGCRSPRQDLIERKHRGRKENDRSSPRD
jgi:hypothetical protein